MTELYLEALLGIVTSVMLFAGAAAYRASGAMKRLEEVFELKLGHTNKTLDRISVQLEQTDPKLLKRDLEDLRKDQDAIKHDLETLERGYNNLAADFGLMHRNSNEQYHEEDSLRRRQPGRLGVSPERL